MPSVYHWGGRSLDEAKISQAEQARAGEAICRPSDRSATPAAATWTAAAATAGTSGVAFGRAARPIPTATRAPPVWHFDRSVCRWPVSYTHLRAHETDSYLVCR